MRSLFRHRRKDPYAASTTALTSERYFGDIGAICIYKQYNSVKPFRIMAQRTSKVGDISWVVVGPRTLSRRAPVLAVLEKANQHKRIARVIHGGSPGPELYAAQWAVELGLEAICCAADWVLHQELAAVDRNRRMIVDYHPDGVIIFPGTLFGYDLAARAGTAKIPVWRPHVRERL